MAGRNRVASVAAGCVLLLGGQTYAQDPNDVCTDPIGQKPVETLTVNYSINNSGRLNPENNHCGVFSGNGCIKVEEGVTTDLVFVLEDGVASCNSDGWIIESVTIVSNNRDDVPGWVLDEFEADPATGIAANQAEPASADYIVRDHNNCEVGVNYEIAARNCSTNERITRRMRITNTGNN